MKNTRVIGVKQCLQHLKDGMTRDDIAEYYGITKAECKLLFKHPDLLGKKTHKKPSFTIVDDAEVAVEDIEVVEAEVVKEEVAIAEVEVENFIEDEVKKSSFGEKYLNGEEVTADAEEPAIPAALEDETAQVEAEVEAQDTEQELPIDSAEDVLAEAAKAEWN